MAVLNSGNDSNSATTTQSSGNVNTETDATAQAKAFFDANADLISVGKVIQVPVTDSEANQTVLIDVTITELNADGSITAESAEGEKFSIPYSAVKSYIDDERAKEE